MVKFVGQSEGGTRTLIGLGLSRRNTERLLAGEPIRVKVDAPLPEGLALPLAIDIVLCGGETEATIAADIQREFPAATHRRYRERGDQ